MSGNLSRTAFTRAGVGMAGDPSDPPKVDAVEFWGGNQLLFEIEKITDGLWRIKASGKAEAATTSLDSAVANVAARANS